MTQQNLSIEETAKILLISTDDVQRLIDNGELYYQYIDGKTLIPVEQLNDLLNG